MSWRSIRSRKRKGGTLASLEQRLAAAPAAVYVITQEDIRRSGPDRIPETLRLAPGLPSRVGRRLHTRVTWRF